MTTFNVAVLPGRRTGWYPYRPVGTVAWEPGEDEVKYRIGKVRPRKKTTETHAVCYGGPYHGVRVQSRFFQGTGKAKALISELPPTWRVPPYSGAYRWHDDTDGYVWTDEAWRMADHVAAIDRHTARKGKRGGQA